MTMAKVKQNHLIALQIPELELYIEETRQYAKTVPVFKLAELAHLFMSCMEQLGVNVDNMIERKASCRVPRFASIS